MEIINETVMRFLDSKNTDYSILISGAWGAGKTHYIKNRLIKEVERKHYNNSSYWKTIYISVYGANSVHEVLRRIIYSKLPEKSKSVVNPGLVDSLIAITEPLPAISGFSKSLSKGVVSLERFISERLNLSGYLIIIDDLERVGDNVEINNLLGTIFNFFIEEKKFKILFVGNEEELINRWVRYQIIREKVIRRVITYSPDKEKIVEEYWNDRHEANRTFIEYLNENKNVVLEVWSRANESNLRTLGFALDAFSIIFGLCKTSPYDKILGNIFYLILILSIEYKKGNLTEPNEELKNILSTISTSVSLWNMQEKSDSKESEKPFYVKFYDIYLQESVVDYIYIDAIFDLIVDGHFDNRQLMQELDSILSHEKSLEQKELDSIIDFYKLEQDELKELIHSVLIHIKDGKYAIGKYPYIYSLFLFIEEKGYLDDFPRKFANDFLEGVERAKVYPGTLVDDMFIRHAYYSEATKDRIFENIVERVKQRVKKAGVVKHKTVIEKFIDDINNIDHTSFLSLYNELDTINIFETIVKENLVQKIFTLTNLSLYRLELIIHDKYTSISNAGEVRYADKEYLETIADYLQNNLGGVEIDNMRKVRLKEIISRLHNAAEHLEKTKRQ